MSGLLRSLFLLTVVLFAAVDSSAELTCRDTPEGRLCTHAQPIVSLTVVSVDDQRELGLVTVNGGCSGTLLKRSWVITAHHCVAVAGVLGGPLLDARSIVVQATWSTRTVRPSRIKSFVRAGPSGATNGQQPDIALLYLGEGDFGPVNFQLLFAGDVTGELSITQFGRGFGTLATGSFMAGATTPPTRANGADRYRLALFTPVPVTNPATAFTPAVVGGFSWVNANPANAASNIGQGGDSGGPSVVTTPDGVGVGIAGVQSTCTGTYIPGYTPPPGTANIQWQWIGLIRSCYYAAINPIRDLIVADIQEGRVPCKDASAACMASELSAFVLLTQ